MATGEDKSRDGAQGTTETMAAPIEAAERALHRRRQSFLDEPGIPQAVQRQRKGAQQGAEFTGRAARAAWLLDLLAWGRYGQVAPRVDQRGPGSSMPPVILPDAPDGELVCLDLAASVDRLRSRHRAFSQVAGRYSALVLAARESNRRLRIEVWDLDGIFLDSGAFTEAATLPEISIADVLDGQSAPRGGGEGLESMLRKVATYIDADISLESLLEARALLSDLLDDPMPDALVARNPLAWALQLAGTVGTGG